MSRISSKKYLAGSRGQQCSLRIPGVCNNDPDTVVPAHIRDRHKGGGTKASDISVANACSSCHDYFDRRSWRNGDIISNEEWLAYALRGLQETLEQRIAAGLMVVPMDIEKGASGKKIKPRKLATDRASIPGRKDYRWPKRIIPTKTNI